MMITRRSAWVGKPLYRALLQYTTMLKCKDTNRKDECIHELGYENKWWIFTRSDACMVSRTFWVYTSDDSWSDTSQRHAVTQSQIRLEFDVLNLWDDPQGQVRLEFDVLNPWDDSQCGRAWSCGSHHPVNPGDLEPWPLTADAQCSQGSDPVSGHFGHVSSVHLDDVISRTDAGLVSDSTSFHGRDEARTTATGHCEAVRIRPHNRRWQLPVSRRLIPACRHCRCFFHTYWPSLLAALLPLGRQRMHVKRLIIRQKLTTNSPLIDFNCISRSLDFQPSNLQATYAARPVEFRHKSHLSKQCWLLDQIIETGNIPERSWTNKHIILYYLVEVSRFTCRLLVLNTSDTWMMGRKQSTISHTNSSEQWCCYVHSLMRTSENE